MYKVAENEDNMIVVDSGYWMDTYRLETNSTIRSLVRIAKRGGRPSNGRRKSNFACTL